MKYLAADGACFCISEEPLTVAVWLRLQWTGRRDASAERAPGSQLPTPAFCSRGCLGRSPLCLSILEQQQWKQKCLPVGYSTHSQGKLHLGWLFKNHLSDKAPKIISRVHLCHPYTPRKTLTPNDYMNVIHHECARQHGLFSNTNNGS